MICEEFYWLTKKLAWQKDLYTYRNFNQFYIN